MIEISLYGFALLPLIIGLVAMVRTLGLSRRLLPVASLAFGIGAAFLATDNVKQAIVTGVALGLASSGLYAGVKATADK